MKKLFSLFLSLALMASVLPTASAAGFADVKAGDWYCEAVDYVVANGIMSGYSDTQFGPNDPLTRAMVVQVLYNKEGQPGLNGAAHSFTDVPADRWYNNAVTWGAGKGVVSGFGDGKFRPDDAVTVEQVAVILHNYTGKPAADGEPAGVGKYDDWAKEALAWAAAQGVLENVPFTDATENATRAMTAQMLTNYLTAADDYTYELLGIPGSTVVAAGANAEVTAEEFAVMLLAYSQQTMEALAYYGVDSNTMWQLPMAENLSMEDYIVGEALKEGAYHSLIRHYAGQEGVGLSDADRAAITEQMAQVEAAARQAGWETEEYMKLFFMTPDVLVRSLESEALYTGLLEKLCGEGTEGYPTYEQIKAELEAANAYTVKHILFATVDTATGQPLDEVAVQVKKRQAQQTLEQLQASADLQGDFDRLMRQLSEDPGLAAYPNGYTFTDADSASLDPAFDQAARALAVGELSGIVEGQSGYHILLRIPLEVDAGARGQAYAAEKMAARVNEWIEAADVRLNEVGLSMRPKAIYEKALDYVMAHSSN